MGKNLVRQEANQPEQTMPWNQGAKDRYKLDEDEVEQLEDDKVVWRGNTAFQLEHTED